MVKRYDVDSLRSSGGRFSHVGEIGPGGTVYHLAGQTGTAADGTSPDGITAQAELVYSNIAAVLEGCGMSFDNLAKITTYLVNRDDIEGWRAVHKKHLGDVVPANTLLLISGLARPDLLIEVEAVAAKD